MRRPDWRVVMYVVVLLVLLAAVAWGIATCGCSQPS